MLNASRLEEAQALRQKLLTAQAGNPGEGFAARAHRWQRRRQVAALRRCRTWRPTIRSSRRMRLCRRAGGTQRRDEKTALDEVREAQALASRNGSRRFCSRRVLQKGSNAAALERLNGYLQKYPTSCEIIRLNYARTCSRTSISAARAEFGSCWLTFRPNTEVHLRRRAARRCILTITLWRKTNCADCSSSDYRDKDASACISPDRRSSKVPDALKWYSEVERSDQYIPAQVRSPTCSRSRASSTRRGCICRGSMHRARSSACSSSWRGASCCATEAARSRLPGAAERARRPPEQGAAL